MSAIKVFISSTICCMKTKRNAAEQAIRALGLEPVISKRTSDAYPASNKIAPVRTIRL